MDRMFWEASLGQLRDKNILQDSDCTDRTHMVTKPWVERLRVSRRE